MYPCFYVAATNEAAPTGARENPLERSMSASKNTARHKATLHSKQLRERVAFLYLKDVFQKTIENHVAFSLSTLLRCIPVYVAATNEAAATAARENPLERSMSASKNTRMLKRAGQRRAASSKVRERKTKGDSLVVISL